MDWKQGISDIVQKYAQGGGTATASEDPHQDFQQAAQAAPRDVVASGISQAFRSDQTPPFPEMVARLFGRSDPNQRAGVLNHLLSSISPGTLTALPGVGNLAGLLGVQTVSPEQANQVSPEQVQQLAAHAERHNPSIVDEVSGFYAQHPNVIKALGGLAASIALQHMLQRG
ncbi:MAG TPA: hypothetical protein VKX49_26730 [Bryobacteraceae bacterium]|nr:hypothetical protein [Bryobacteraceae bacterium]